jgi:hypothetical protein
MFYPDQVPLISWRTTLRFLRHLLSNDPMIPRTLALEPGPAVHTVHNGCRFWGRPSVVDVRHDLRSVLAATRQDADLSSPGLRQRWDAGDLAPFHGWDER